MTRTSKEEIVDFSEADEIEEGYPKVVNGAYLARAIDPTVVVSKAGQPYVEYTPVLLESTNSDNSKQDKNGLPLPFKLPKDRIILFANPVDRDGNLKTGEKLAADSKRMLGTARGVVRKMTGEDFTARGTKNEVAQELANAIKGATFVAMVGIQPEAKGFAARNIVREHRAEADWGKLVG